MTNPLLISHSFCIATPYVNVTATGSKAAVSQIRRLGYYELLETKTNDFPAWVSIDGNAYLYRDTGGKWYIGPELEKPNLSGMESPVSDSPFTPGMTWRYYDLAKFWADDDSLKVSRFEVYLGKLQKIKLRTTWN